MVYSTTFDWSYLEFGSKLDSWKTYRRTIYTSSTTDEDGQLLLEFARPDNILYTNIGMNETVDQRLIDASEENALGTEAIIKRYHQNGESELVHRSLKEFAGSEKLPFKRFGANGAYYYLMIIAHLLFQAYKEDVGEGIAPIKSYPNTARRKLIDFAVKIVKTAGSVILKVTEDIARSLQIQLLWFRCNNPIPIL
jgi:hypothetical protein